MTYARFELNPMEHNPAPGAVHINPQHVASIYVSEIHGNPFVSIVLANGIGYSVQGTEEEVCAKLKACTP